MTADLMLIWPELILTIGGLITLMLGTFFGDRNVGLYQLSSLLTLAAAAAAVVARLAPAKPAGDAHLAAGKAKPAPAHGETTHGSSHAGGVQ